ncbi:unnamed protein product [Acanthoscelides obtectus]|uniref:Uncharacterized protein n=1 Tax=Acanthoscelides obtectus TaxID=200917 RepID=A0A9P0K8F8_ACAOB|nr:unnamed protein product [Acanthoscelides obtectus]CAK1655988.1 hypothetical protein AOBTE_LOCUS19493 [Acanthoscelides obtectus]
MGSNSDDFWTSGSSLVFNFDDDDEEIVESVDDFVFKTSEDCSVVPIHSIITKHCLDLILADAKPRKHDLPSVEIAIQRLLNGQKSAIYIYRSLKHKISLLEAALDIKEGNLILMIQQMLYKCWSIMIPRYLV